MTVRYQADADLNQAIVTGVLRRQPTIDFQTAFAAELEGVRVLLAERRVSDAPWQEGGHHQHGAAHERQRGADGQAPGGGRRSAPDPLGIDGGRGRNLLEHILDLGHGHLLLLSLASAGTTRS